MESERLKLLPPSMNNQPQILAAIRNSKAELSEYLPWVGNALTVEGSVNDTKQAIKNFENFEGELRFSIFVKESNEFVGAIGLIIRDKSVPFFEIGYWLKSSSVGSGYVTEAVDILEKYAFQDLNAKRVEINAAEGNLKSRAVAERCGYKYEGILQNHRRLPNGEISNTVVYAKIDL